MRVCFKSWYFNIIYVYYEQFAFVIPVQAPQALLYAYHVHVI